MAMRLRSILGILAVVVGDVGHHRSEPQTSAAAARVSPAAVRDRRYRSSGVVKGTCGRSESGAGRSTGADGATCSEGDLRRLWP